MLGAIRAILAATFAFGIATLWVKDLWPWAAFQTAVFCICAVWCIYQGWSSESLRGGMQPPRLSTASLALPFAVAAWGALQLAFGWTQAAWQTRATALEWLTHGCAAVLAYAAFRDSRTRRTALRAFAVAAAIVALLSILQNYTSPGRIWWLWDSGFTAAVYGPFLNHTKLANFAELAIPVAVWLAIEEPRRRDLYIVCAAALAGSVVASASRGGMVILLVELAILSIVAGRSRLRAVLALAAGVAIGIAIFGWETAAFRWAGTDPMAELRIPIARSGLNMAAAFMPAGAGLGTWRIVQPAFATFDLHIAINQAHCDWVQWLAEGGVPWVLIMLAMAWTAVRAAIREWWAVGVLFVLLHAAIDYPFQQTPALTTLIVCVWAVSLNVLRAHSRNSKSFRKSAI